MGGSLREADPGVRWEPTPTTRYFARGPSLHPEVNAVRTVQCLAAGATEVAIWHQRPISWSHHDVAIDQSAGCGDDEPRCFGLTEIGLEFEKLELL